MWHRLCTLTSLAALASLAGPVPSAVALEKYAGGRVQSALPQFEVEGKVLVRGSFLEAVFLDNPSFTARPNNTGRVLLRHDLHLEADLLGPKLTLYTDQNFFSDRQTNSGASLTEHDQAYGVSGLIGSHLGWLIQFESDDPLDQSGLSQRYAAALVTARLNTEQDWPWWERTFPGHPLNAYAGPGWHFLNHDYFARPDSTGETLFRYIAHTDVGLFSRQQLTVLGETRPLVIELFGDMNMNTDRLASSSIRPSELDWIVGLAARWGNDELSLYREEDRPLDRSGFVQQYVALQLRIAFGFSKRDAETLWSHLTRQR